jgi:hypothetical protein
MPQSILVKNFKCKWQIHARFGKIFDPFHWQIYCQIICKIIVSSFLILFKKIVYYSVFRKLFILVINWIGKSLSA